MSLLSTIFQKISQVRTIVDCSCTSFPVKTVGKQTHQMRHSELALILPKVVQQTAVAHQLLHDKDGLSHRADREEADQLAVLQVLHDLCLLHERRPLHRFLAQHLNGHVGRAVPQALPDLPELALSELFHKLQRGPGNFPLVAMRKTDSDGDLGLRAGKLEPEPAHVRMALVEVD